MFYENIYSSTIEIYFYTLNTSHKYQPWGNPPKVVEFQRAINDMWT